MIHPPKQDESQNHACGNPRDSGLGRGALILLDFQNFTTTTASPATTLLEAVINSLSTHGLIPEDKPVHSFPAQFTADRLEGIELVQKGDGWIGNVAFNMPFGDPDVLTTRENLILPTRHAAFVHAAAIVVEILTGVRELPSSMRTGAPGIGPPEACGSGHLQGREYLANTAARYFRPFLIVPVSSLPSSGILPAKGHPLFGRTLPTATERSHMFQLNTARIPQNPDPMECYRDMIVTALNAKSLVPAAPPALSGLPGYVHRDNVKALTLEQEDGLWSYYLHLEHAPSGMPDCIGIPPEFRCETSIEAFMAGAELLCLIFTGEEELPFVAVGNKLMFTAYGPSTAA